MAIDSLIETALPRGLLARSVCDGEMIALSSGRSGHVVGLLLALVLVASLSPADPVAAQRAEAAFDAQAQGQNSRPSMTFAVTTLATKPWLVSGGNALVEIEVPLTVPMHQVSVLLNGDQDVTDAFQQVPGERALRGVVTGLDVGDNTLEVRANGQGRGRPRETLEITNWPSTGPIISGPHQQPFFCQTEQFQVAGGRIGQVLGAPLDEFCSVETRVDYLYKSTAGTLEVLDDPDGPLPADITETTTIEGNTVPYMVRLETGTINRAIYEIAFLHELGTPLPDAVFSTPGWNDRVVYRQGGGCRTGWHVQGDDTAGVLIDELLSRGYATIGASLNRFRNNCAELLSSETTMMVKEHFMDSFGVPLFTIGLGSSGGSYQSHHTADNYPGLFDGIFIGRSFPEVTFATNHKLHDSRLLKQYFDAANAEGSVTWTEEEQRQVSGFGVFNSIPNMDVGAARIDPVADRPDRTSAEFQDVVPDAVRYHPTDNSGGARPTVYDHQVNAFGRDPDTGFARRPLDNVGVQYGLQALNSGAISTEQFLDLNERIGGLDIDANFVPQRTEADPLATRLAYRGGRLVDGGLGLNETPIVDFRNYLDLQPGGDIHMRYHSFSMRERLKKANGDADNHVMITVDSRFSCGFGTAFTCDNPALWEAFDQLAEWLLGIEEDTSARSRAEKVRATKPADLVDACWTRDDPPVRIVEEQTFDGPGECTALYPAFPPPRTVAGAPIEGDVIACARKPIDPADYTAQFTAGEMSRLQGIFPDGVCDWTQPGLEQQPPAGTFLSVGPASVNQIFDVVSGNEMSP